MNPTTFDALTRRVARKTPRRAAIAVMLGGALLLNQPAASDASSLRGISIRVDNTKGTKDVTVLWGIAFAPRDGDCCRRNSTDRIPAGEFRIYQSSVTTGFVFINDRYWFQFRNPETGPPFAQIALNGSFLDLKNQRICCFNCCYRKGIKAGRTVERYREFKEGKTRHYNIQNTALFTVRRHTDLKRYKFFTVTPPPSL